MASIITKILPINFRQFRDYTVTPNEKINILVGDNEVGKSSILETIELVESGNLRRVESIGLDRLINIEDVKEFNLGRRTFDNLPILRLCQLQRANRSRQQLKTQSQLAPLNWRGVTGRQNHRAETGFASRKSIKT